MYTNMELWNMIAEKLNTLFGQAYDIFVQAFSCFLLIILPFICLNGILFSLFLLKSLLFKPKFVENRRQTIGIDSRAQSYGFENSIEIDSKQQRDYCDCYEDGNDQSSTINASSMSTLIQSQLQQLYNTSSSDSLECIAPSNELIKLKEKIGFGFAGVLYKVSGTAGSVYANKCAKLIDIGNLKQIIYEVNGVNTDSLKSISIAKQLESATKQSMLSHKLQHHFQLLKQFASKLNVSTHTSKTNESSITQTCHPNIVYYDQVLIHNGIAKIGQRDKKIFRHLLQSKQKNVDTTLVLLVMPLCAMNLRAALLAEFDSGFNLRTAITWARQIGDGLRYLHEQLRVPHLDLKPENILLDKQKLFCLKNEPSLPLFAQYTVKISDCGSGLLVPTSTKVLSQGHDDSILTMSPLFAEKFSENLNDCVLFDIHCYAMTMLLMLVGYESFQKNFVLSRFPIGLLSVARYHMIESIIEASSSYSSPDTKRIPATFATLFNQIFAASDSKNFDPQPNKGLITMSDVLAHEAFVNFK